MYIRIYESQRIINDQNHFKIMDFKNLQSIYNTTLKNLN